jgi:hypothetical protein
MFITRLLGDVVALVLRASDHVASGDGRSLRCVATVSHCRIRKAHPLPPPPSDMVAELFCDFVACSTHHSQAIRSLDVAATVSLEVPTPKRLVRQTFLRLCRMEHVIPKRCRRCCCDRVA